MDLEATQVLDRPNIEDEKQIGTLSIGSTEFKITEGFNKIGRSPLCNVIIKDTTVSKLHAEIQAGPEATFICDLRSANQTIFKSLPLRPFFFYPINDGDVVVFGQVKAVYTILKKPPETSHDVAPKISVATRACGTARSNAASSPRLEDDPSFDDPNESVVPCSQQNDSNQSLFRRPGRPVERQKNRGSRCGANVETSEKINERDDSMDIFDTETRKIVDRQKNTSNDRVTVGSTKSERANEANKCPNNAGMDIHEMETQEIVDRQKNTSNDRLTVGSTKSKRANEADECPNNASMDIHEMETQEIDDRRRKAVKLNSGGTVVGKCKRTNEADESLEDRSRDIYDMETQDISNRDSFLSPKSPKRPRFQGGSPDVFADRDNIYEADTQILVAVEEPATELPRPVVAADNEDSNTDEENIIDENPQKRCLVIAESDDDSRTDDGTMDFPKQQKKRETDELSDGSITDDENEFASSTVKKIRREERDPPVSPKIRSTAATKQQSKPVTSIYEAETQPMRQDYAPRENPPARVDRIIDEDDELDLLPTQVLDVATSTPMSRRWNKNQPDDSNKESNGETDDRDIHNALTQIVVNEDIEEKKSRAVDLDDTLTKNLGHIFGNDDDDDDDDNDDEGAVKDDPTQLMTQNLVDILKATQGCVARDATTLDPSIPENISTNEKDATGDDVPRDPMRKSIELAGTLGFVDGRAVSSRDEFSDAPTSTSAKKDETPSRGPVEETEEAPGGLDESDILFGLPKVRICGTLSYPGSPTTSATSFDDEDDDDLVPPSREKLGNVREASTKNVTSSRKIVSANVDEIRERVSPRVSPVKSRARGKYGSRVRNIFEDDHDSDDDLDYNDLKRIADKLLASDVTNDARVRKDATGSRGLSAGKSVAAKKNATTSRRTRKLPETPSSLVTDPNGDDSSVDGSNNRVAESSVRDSRKRRAKNSGQSSEKSAGSSGEAPEESFGVVTKSETHEPIIPSKKTYAKVQLTRLNDNEVRSKREDSNVLVPSNIDTPKATRARRLTSISATKRSEASPTSQARAKGRGTIGQTGPIVNERYNVLFTGIKDEDYERIITKLGGSVVSDPSKATVLITDKIRRTFKFLCAVAQGTKIVSINWLTESERAGHFLDCDSFILDDPVAEEKYKFKLSKSLQTAKTKKLLTGYTIIVTPKVNQPEIHELRGMTEACGGRVLVRAARSWDSKMIILSNNADLAAAKSLLAKVPKSVKITVQSTEFLLTGILRQEVNLVDHKLI